MQSVAYITIINWFCRLILKNKHYRIFFVFDQYLRINALRYNHTTAWLRFYRSLCQVLRADYPFRVKLTFLIQQRPMTKYRHLKERNLEERFGSQVWFFENDENSKDANMAHRPWVLLRKILLIGRQWQKIGQCLTKNNVLIQIIQMGMRYSTEDLTSEDYETPLKLR